MTQSQTPAPPVTDARSPALRALVWGGLVLAVMLGVVVLAVGLAGASTSGGQTAICLGLVLLVCAASGLGREWVEHAVRRHPPRPRLATLDGEPALLLPRHRGRGVVAAASLTGLAAVTALGAVLSALAGQPVGAAVLAVVAVALLVAGAPWRVVEDGAWCTPTRLVHEQDNLRWSLPWDDVTGSYAHEPVAVLVRPGHLPHARRGWRSWRLRQRPVRDDTLWIDARHLAGGPALLSYVVLHAIADRSFRAALGSPASLPPGSDS